jgi:DNA-binding transcriptional MerR regulator
MDKSAIHKNDDPSEKRYMKMKELSEITGVKAPTIRYYITQGILPKPYKTHKNMAYYDERYIELIRLVKKFQKEHFLPLEIIKKAMEDLGHDKVPVMEQELTDKLSEAQQIGWMEPAAINKLVKPVNKEKLMEISKISKRDLEKSIKKGMLVADKNGCFNVQNVKLASLIAQVREHLSDERGFSFDFIAIHNDFILNVVDKEFKFFFTRILSGELTVPVANELAEKCIELFYDMFPIIHKRYLNKKIKDSLSIK